MATIGLYDIDFHHNKNNFTINLFLAQMYSKMIDTGHHVIMMKKEEESSCFNKVYWFKENPRLAVPTGLFPDIDKSAFIGHGFNGYSGIEDIYQYEPNFFPYDCSFIPQNKIKKYRKIRNNNLIDWRTKDISHWKKGKTYTFIHDEDFLLESDWKDAFSTFNNNIEFMRPIRILDYNQKDQFFKFYQGHTNFIMKLPREEIEKISTEKNIAYDVSKEPLEKIFLYMLFLKGEKKEYPNFIYMNKDLKFSKSIYEWYKSKSQESFSKYTNGKYNNTIEYLKFPYRILLKQTPNSFLREEILDILNKEEKNEQ